MAYVGCPNCRKGVHLGDRAQGCICLGCQTYFSKDKAVEPEYDATSKGVAVHGEGAADREALRSSIGQMADDSKTGKAREQGGSHYRNKYRYRAGLGGNSRKG